MDVIGFSDDVPEGDPWRVAGLKRTKCALAHGAVRRPNRAVDEVPDAGPLRNVGDEFPLPGRARFPTFGSQYF